MNEQIRKVKDKYAEYWRRIPSFPMYEMNMLEQVRDVRHKQMVSRVNRRMYFLARDGKQVLVSGKSLYQSAYPLTERPEV
jgi:hypothetical protein